MLVCVAIKKAILNLRLRPEVRDEFAVAAELRGASMSGLLHQFIVRTIREEKELSPQSFAKGERSVYGKVTDLNNEVMFSRIDRLDEDLSVRVANVRSEGEMSDDKIQDRKTASRPPAKRKGQSKAAK